VGGASLPKCLSPFPLAPPPPPLLFSFLFHISFLFALGSIYIFMDLLGDKWIKVYPEPGKDSIMGMKADKTAAGCLKVPSRPLVILIVILSHFFCQIGFARLQCARLPRH